ncbi:MAG TPA: tape measure protein, partial [Nitrososphaera sp.]
MVALELMGGPKFSAQVTEAAAAMTELGLATATTGRGMEAASKKTFLENQALFTLRRYAFYGTMAIAGMGIEALKMGWEFDSAMNTARVSMNGFLGNINKTNAALNQLYIYAAITPFEFPDIVMASRRLLPFFNKNVEATQKAVETLGNSLAAFGVVSGASLSRATLAIAHMMNIGRLTGQVLYQMGRDNIPMMLALEHHFHQSGEAIREMVSGGQISAKQALSILEGYVATAKGFKNAAAALGTQTLPGAWATFKDLIRMSFGKSEGGLFESVRKTLNGINKELLRLVTGNKPITIERLFKAIDKGITPHSHIIIEFFYVLSSAIKTTIVVLKLFVGFITVFLWIVNGITGLFGANKLAAKLLGTALGVLIGLYIIFRAQMMLTEIAMGAQKTALLGMRGAAVLLGIEMEGLSAKTIPAFIKSLKEWAFAEKMVETFNPKTQKIEQVGTGFINQGKVAQGLRSLMKGQLLSRMFGAMLYRATLAASALWDVLLGPVGIIILFIGLLVYLYFRWKFFHDLVNKTAEYFWKNWKWAGLLMMLIIPGLGIWIYLVGLLIKNWDKFRGVIMSVYHALTLVWNVIKKIWGGVKHGIGKAWGFLKPRYQHGGVVAQSGHAIVGENGPETVFLPQGSVVVPGV